MAESEEDVLSYVAFPQQAEAYFRSRDEKKALKVSYTITEAE
jgi:oxaloacetate decarboxylase alpha subunit